MSFPRYPKYKPSGVEWLGEVPEGWGLPKLKSVATFSGGGTPSRDDPRYWNGDIPWVSPKDMKAERIEGAEESITEEGLRNSASNLLQAGRVLIVVRSGILKHTIPIAINETAVALNQDMKALSFDATKCAPRFFLRWVQGHNDQLLFAWAKQGATVESIEHSYLAQTVVPLPPLPEQTAIAEFLDRETGKIDGLVAEQRRLMELLKEKRQAVISHAVTKGLNLHAPMKPSGIEWLGDVPVGWEVFALNRLVQPGRRITYGIVQPGERDENGRFMVRGQDYSFGWSKPETLFKVSDAVEIPYRRARLMKGDLVITIVGAGVGNVEVVPSWLDGANITQTTARISVDTTKADPRFVSGVLKGPIGRRSVELYAKGAAQPGLNLEHVRIFPITVPPLSEQREIADYIDTETKQFDTLTAEAQRAIDLLQERRTALISAAVTGQIDVRQQTRN